MKLSILASAAALAATVNAGAVYKRADSSKLVLATTGETCTIKDGTLTCAANTTPNVDSFSASAVGVGSVSKGIMKTPPANVTAAAEAAAKATRRDLELRDPEALEVGGTSPALHSLDKRWFLFGCGSWAANKCAAKCAYQGYCASSCSWWGLSCSCSCRTWQFPGPWGRPTCWASDCNPRYPWDGGCGNPGGCGGGGYPGGGDGGYPGGGDGGDGGYPGGGDGGYPGGGGNGDESWGNK